MRDGRTVVLVLAVVAVAWPRGGRWAPVAGIPPSLLPAGPALQIPGVWLMLVQGRALAEPIRAG